MGLVRFYVRSSPRIIRVVAAWRAAWPIECQAMRNDELVPLKRVLGEIGISRSTLWRALNSKIPGFPDPTLVGRRLHWTREELVAIDRAMGVYRGRVAFDAMRRRDRARFALIQLKQAERRQRRKAIRVRMPDQVDLFTAMDDSEALW